MGMGFDLPGRDAPREALTAFFFAGALIATAFFAVAFFFAAGLRVAAFLATVFFATVFFFAVAFFFATGLGFLLAMSFFLEVNFFLLEVFLRAGFLRAMRKVYQISAVFRGFQLTFLTCV